METVIAPTHEDPAVIEARIKEILGRGKVVRFTHKFFDYYKDVKEWNPDNMGDLKAFRHTATTPWVCWDGIHYTISEVDE